MIPLSMCNIGEDEVIKKIGGNQEAKKHLENLGFHVGSQVRIVSSLKGNLIIKVKESRIAISEELARKMMV